jgi:hypothetical protein
LSVINYQIHLKTATIFHHFRRFSGQPLQRFFLSLIGQWKPCKFGPRDLSRTWRFFPL